MKNSKKIIDRERAENFLVNAGVGDRKFAENISEKSLEQYLTAACKKNNAKFENFYK